MRYGIAVFYWQFLAVEAYICYFNMLWRNLNERFLRQGTEN